MAHDDHPLIPRLKGVLPHLLESNAFLELELSTWTISQYKPQDEVESDELYVAHLLGVYRPSMTARKAGLDFPRLAPELATPDLPARRPGLLVREGEINVHRQYLWNLPPYRCLMAWERPWPRRDELWLRNHTFHLMSTLYKDADAPQGVWLGPPAHEPET